ncbi:MAG: formyltransferase [Candidatus Aureabacteria bacterium]|nr:formyltransferase [Candidatus Auribacterota bacterium]
MKIIVMGYHNIGYACLQKLIEIGADITAVVTHADNPRENIWFRSVRDLAFEHCIPVYQPPDANSPEMVAAVRRIAPDMIFSFYFRQVLGKELLEIPRIGAFNLHGSLLPRYRGRCPINWVLVHGEKETGVTLHRMELKPDRGAILAQRVVPIDFKDTALTLFEKMTVAAAELIADIYPKMLTSEIRELPQEQRQASYFGGRTAKDGRIDWSRRATEIYNLVRAVTHPYPGAFTEAGGRKLFIWWAEPDEEAPTEDSKPGEIIALRAGEGIVVATGKGILRLKKIQWEGEGEIDAETLPRGSALAPGAFLR